MKKLLLILFLPLPLFAVGPANIYSPDGSAAYGQLWRIDSSFGFVSNYSGVLYFDTFDSSEFDISTTSYTFAPNTPFFFYIPSEPSYYGRLRLFLPAAGATGEDVNIAWEADPSSGDPQKFLLNDFNQIDFETWVSESTNPSNITANQFGNIAIPEPSLVDLVNLVTRSNNLLVQILVVVSFATGGLFFIAYRQRVKA